MFFDLLLIFIILSIIFMVLSIFLMESDNPTLAIPFIMIGIIFTVLCTYGWWNVEFLYTSVNITTGGTDASIYSTDVYGDPYSYVFMFMFFVYLVLFFRTGFNMWKVALEQQGEMDYRTRDRRWR